MDERRATHGQVDIPRDGAGRYVRTVDNAERDGKACKLAAQGWTYAAIAAELGYGSKQAAHAAIHRTLLETANTRGASEMRETQLAEMGELRRAMWSIVNDPPPVVSRTGKVVVDANGEPVPDAAAQVQAAAVLIRAGERTARLRGLDAPKLSLSAELARMSPSQLRGLAEMERREPGTTGVSVADLRAETARVLAEAEAAENVAQPAPKVIQGRAEPAASGAP